MEKFVAIYSKNEVVTVVHAGHHTGDYASLCGLDGDDPELDQHPGDLPSNPKVSCPECAAIIRHSKKYLKKDIKL